jgi:hypothetical protein
MRIIAGNSKINILSEEQNNGDFIVLAQLVDSKMGYEKPVLVRNSQELLIWFGDEFEDFKYLKELLDDDRVSLYLYRIIETGTSQEMNILPDYYYIPDVTPNSWKVLEALDNQNSEETGEIHSSFNDHLLPNTETLNPANDDTTLYKVIRSDGLNYDLEKKVRYSYYKYNRVSDSYLLFDSLERNKKNKSLQNRDRLSVGYYQYEGNEEKIISYSYCHRGMDYVTEKESNIGTVEIEDFDKFQKEISEGHATKHLLISGKNLTIEDLKNDPYIPLIEDNGRYSYTLPEIEVEVEEEGELVTKTDKLTYFFEIPLCTDNYVTPENTVNGIVQLPQEISQRAFMIVRDLTSSPTYGLATENFLREYYRNVPVSRCKLQDLVSINRYEGYLWGRPEFISYNNFYNVPEKLELKTDFLSDQLDIYNYYVEGGEIYRFESKTIGKGGDNIKIEIKWIETYTEKNNIYSVIISRYDYHEFFEGPFEDEFGIERLDDKISRESKLVNFQIIPQVEPEEGWPEGNWELKGAYDEDGKDIEYSFNKMCIDLEDFPPDFIMISKKSNGPYESRILDWTKNLNCQALITDTSEDWEGNIESKEDPENRLIHFYNPVEVEGWEKPGYYVFLKNLLSNDVYLPSITKLLYEFPEDSIGEDVENRDAVIDILYENLEKYRSNYLISNNLIYYYDYYFPGDQYITTPLVRFVISKVTRELEKNKWKIIGEKADKISEDLLYPILQKIQERFSIIRSITIDKFVVDGISRTVEASITTTLSDIISSDVSFDIILNYSKLNN